VGEEAGSIGIPRARDEGLRVVRSRILDGLPFHPLDMGEKGRRPDGFGQQPTMPLRSFENPGPPNFGLPTTAPFTVEGQIEREWPC
jgi:hypothetical protein